MSMFVLDISKAVSDNVVEWLQFFSNNSLETPEVAILYSLVAGRGELIMFGGLQKDVAMMRNQAAANENDSVTNALYFLTPPCEIV
jgi:F-box protein 42